MDEQPNNLELNKNQAETIDEKIQNNKKDSFEQDKEQDKKAKIKNRKKHKGTTWPFIVLIITFMLSFAFSLGSEFLLSGTGIIISVVLLIFFLALAMISDMIGVAVTAVEIEPFNAMSSKKVKGAKESIMLIKNADKVASIFCDIVGDICGILSGSVGASLTLQIIGTMQIGFTEVLIASLVSASIAGITVFLKSVGKKLAIKHAHTIIWSIGKLIKFFKFGK